MNKVQEFYKNVLDPFMESRGIPLTESKRLEVINGMSKFRRLYTEAKRYDIEHHTQAESSYTEKQEQILADWLTRHPEIVITHRSKEFYMMRAEAERRDLEAEATAKKLAGEHLFHEWQKKEYARMEKLFTQPYDKVNGVGKDWFAYGATYLDDEALADYNETTDNQKVTMFAWAIEQAQNEIQRALTPDEKSALQQFMLIQNPPMNPGDARNYFIAFNVLKLEGVIDPVKPEGRVLTSTSVPELPPVQERVVNKEFEGGRQDVAREVHDKAIAEIKSKIGYFIDEIGEASGITVPDSVISELWTKMVVERLEVTRENVRRTFWRLYKSQVPNSNVFQPDEIATWTEDAADERNLSADEYRMRVRLYGR